MTALDLARAREPTKRRALFSLEERQGLKFFGPSASSTKAACRRGRDEERASRSAGGDGRALAEFLALGNFVAWIGEHSVLVLSRLLFPGGSFFFFFWVSRGKHVGRRDVVRRGELARVLMEPGGAEG